MFEYSKYVIKLSYILFEFIFGLFGFNSNYLKDMDCVEELMLLGYYYLLCFELDVVIGFGKYVDVDVFIVFI